MTGATKITLSDFELAKVLDSEWILTKKRIMEKAAELLNQQVPVINITWQSYRQFIPQDLETAMPRIYKGEQYRGLPYVILDYPSVFGKEDLFALRTMFWWGNFFSISLHLAGKYKEQLAPRIIGALNSASAGFFICINEDPWEHHFDDNNYVPASKMVGSEQLLLDNPFIKVALQYDLKEWNELPRLLDQGYQQLFALFKG